MRTLLDMFGHGNSPNQLHLLFCRSRNRTCHTKELLFIFIKLCTNYGLHLMFICKMSDISSKIFWWNISGIGIGICLWFWNGKWESSTYGENMIQFYKRKLLKIHSHHFFIIKCCILTFWDPHKANIMR